jgi:pimeloyl-ACP methyl ester carboxylesterase
MTTFALVHGAWHGAWCWERLTPFLQQAGHDVVAMDLPGEDGTATFDTYADVVCAALTGCDDDVVLVGHSLGGGTVPLVAARLPVRNVVYLCAFIPAVGRSLSDEFDDVVDPRCYAGLTASDGQTTWTNREIARAVLYADCDADTADAALRRLRPQARYPSNRPFSLVQLPSVRSTYVVCSDDKIIRPEWSRRVARERLGAAVVELPGSHSPLLSRPSAVAAVLISLVD